MISRVLHTLFRHTQSYPVVLVCMALLFGGTCILPNLWQRTDAQYPFQGIEALGADQEHVYAVRIREVMDGHWMLGDVYHAQKDLPYLQPPLPEWIMGGMGVLFGWEIGTVILVSKMLFGALLFFVIALFWTRMTQRPWMALLATSAVLFSWFLFASPGIFLDAMRGLPLGQDFARFSRLTNPQFSMMLFFLALYGVAGWLLGKGRRSLALAAVVTGLSFYAYPYTWSYLLVVFGLLLFWSLVRKEWSHVKDLALAGVIVGIFAVPFVWHMASVSQLPAYAELAQRFGLVASHAPVGGVWMVLFLLTALCAGSRISRASRLLIALAVGAMVVMNQQVLTGKVIVPHHYHWYFIQPLAVMTLILAASVLYRQYVRVFGSVLLGIFLVATVYWGMRYQQDAYRAQRSLWGEMQQVAGVFQFLNTLSQPTVYADDLVGSIIPVFTDANMSFAGAANVSCLCSFELIRDSYFLELWLKGVTAEEAARTFPTTARGSVSAKLYGLYYRESQGAYEAIPDEAIAETVRAYRAYAVAPLAEKLRRSPTDIIVRAKAAPSTAQLRAVLARGALVYQDAWYEAWDITKAVR